MRKLFYEDSQDIRDYIKKKSFKNRVKIGFYRKMRNFMPKRSQITDNRTILAFAVQSFRCYFIDEFGGSLLG